MKPHDTVHRCGGQSKSVELSTFASQSPWTNVVPQLALVVLIRHPWLVRQRRERACVLATGVLLVATRLLTRLGRSGRVNLGTDVLGGWRRRIRLGVPVPRAGCVIVGCDVPGLRIGRDVHAHACEGLGQGRHTDLCLLDRFRLVGTMRHTSPHRPVVVRVRCLEQGLGASGDGVAGVVKDGVRSGRRTRSNGTATCSGGHGLLVACRRVAAC
mmetsp:Transcript_58486/g.165200  ORF Transcript_58486/g.165200 Transcript_58486/m.165200 type:complete len:213 (+) Transcript_58486:465-1103(+)